MQIAATGAARLRIFGCSLRRNSLRLSLHWEAIRASGLALLRAVG